MILFFYGEDTFRLKQKVRKLKEKFISASLGDTNLAVLNGEAVSYEEITRQVLAFPFLSKTRLVILENLLKSGKKETQEKIIELLSKIPQTTVLVFLEEGTPDRRTALFKKLNQPKIVEEFKVLEGLELEKYVLKLVEEKSGEISRQAMEKLMNYCGNNLWRLNNELDKLVAYDPKITGESIELLVSKEINQNIFALTDAVSSQSLKRSLLELNKMQQAGEADLYIFSMIVSQYRNMLVVKDLVNRKTGSSFAIAKRAAIHPFVVQKTISAVQNRTIDELKESYRTLLDFDCQIKTGKIESKTALTLLLTKLINNYH